MNTMTLETERDNYRIVVVTAQGNHYATTYDPTAARLIAVAPELLEACKSMLEWMEFTIPKVAEYKHSHTMNWGGPISKAKTAIAKVESGVR